MFGSEESKLHGNREGEEEDEHAGDALGGLFLYNRYATLIGVEDDEGVILYSGIEVGKADHYSQESEELGADHYSQVYGSVLAISFRKSRGRFGQQQRGSDGVYHPKGTILTSVLKDWPRWDHSLSMEFLGISNENGHKLFKYTRLQPYEDAQLIFDQAQNNLYMENVETVLREFPYHTDSLISSSEFFDLLGIHKSALETCKMLLSLHDPTYAMLCVDYFALREREYGWQERFADEYRGDNSLWLLPNFSYSLAVARLYLEKTETDSSKPSSLDLMKQALILYPTVLGRLVVKVPLESEKWDQIVKHPYFHSNEFDYPTLDHLINIYIERSYLIWRPYANKLLMEEAALETIILLDSNLTDARDWDLLRKKAFPSNINQYSHLSIHDFSNESPTIPQDVGNPLREDD
ncbi:PREDICTED: transcription factor 25-like [Camelina sativa]|uniref:Transcription factor 25-like n=1 Tax=Camelina sativa TaxID=90675 RepID=A0ABM0WP65_CAMSA|nr:PREDICTED: transcription factor 25-like [Camelina sativa]